MKKFLLMILCCYATAVFAEVKCIPSGADDICYQLHQSRLATKLVEAGKELERLDRPTANHFYIAQNYWRQFVESNCQYESEPARNTLGSGHYRVQQKCIALMYDERFQKVDKKIQQLKKQQQKTK